MFVAFSSCFLAVFQLFILSQKLQHQMVTEFVTFPCLRIFKRLIQPPPATSKKNKVP